MTGWLVVLAADHMHSTGMLTRTWIRRSPSSAKSAIAAVNAFMLPGLHTQLGIITGPVTTDLRPAALQVSGLASQPLRAPTPQACIPLYCSL
jgi:hypothetical protein